MPIIILYELVDFIKVIRIKMFALVKCLSTDSTKSCALLAFVLPTLSSCHGTVLDD